jgi:glycosyltransferase involved in cell wall biosynthesis
LIHDDASTDGTRKIIEEYMKKYPGVFKPIFRKTNMFSKTEVYPFWENLKRAKGKYIADCDGEDFWSDPYKLQQQVDFLENNSEYVLTHHKYIIRTPKGDIPPTLAVPKDFTELEMLQYSLSGHGIGLRTRVYRNLLGEGNAADIEYMAGDYSWVVYLGLYGKTKYMEHILPAVYRFGHGNNSWADLPKATEQRKIKEMMLHIYKFFADKEDTINANMRSPFLSNPYYDFTQKDVPRVAPRQVTPAPVVKNTIPYPNRGRTIPRGLPPNWR